MKSEKMFQMLILLVFLWLVTPVVFTQVSVKADDKPKVKSATTSFDFTPEEAAQLKEVSAQRIERQKEAKTAGEAIATAKTDEDAIKNTLRFQLANERLTSLQLAEILLIMNAKIRVNCLDCEYKGSTLVKPEAVKTETPK